MGERILIWGAGAIGGSVGAWLRRAGHDVTFVDVVAEHVAAIRDIGLRITGPVEEFSVRVPAFTPADVDGVWQRVFLAVKAQDTEAATRALTPHLAQDGRPAHAGLAFQHQRPSHPDAVQQPIGRGLLDRR